MIPQEIPPSGPIDSMLQRLTSFQNLLRSAARRSWFFSWFSWGFLFAVLIGLGVVFVLSVLFPLVTSTVTPSGVTYSTASQLWAYLLPMLPSVALLFFAVRQVMLGREEARTGASQVRPSRREAPSSPGASWTEVVRRSQELIAQMRSESEAAFVPLLLGGLILGVLVPGVLLTGYSITAPLSPFVAYLLVFPFLLLLIPLYLGVRDWTRGYQVLLDRQVGSLSRLEQEFFTRFAGIAANA